jgi:hypothetical protein
MMGLICCPVLQLYLDTVINKGTESDREARCFTGEIFPERV